MTSQMIKKVCLVALMGAVLAGCSTRHPTRDLGTVGGAALGGGAGYALTDGNPLAALGGAALGGLVGNQVFKDSDDRYDRGRRHYRDDRRRDRHYHRHDRRRWDD
ncbi:MAG: glycine zipper 2TM domain-containing protein [Advenella sp.]|uniref:glycine zipper 2TM domain-containing protein n=1 Tax=unclassified Advenella TaxID=2685285 RepID=UPI001D035535|nr:glycine zipper 2TM domain-containing protein [Advenella sp. FME57]